MKKLLILMLVLCMASAANATLTLVSSAGTTILTGTTTMIGINTDVGLAGGGMQGHVVVDEADASMGSWTGGGGTIYYPPSIVDTAGSVYTYYYGAASGYGDMWLIFGVAPTPALGGTGILADFEFGCDGIGDVTITLWNSDLTAVLDTITITQIPEPMTIALLGLGGLFLRRRK